jgi:hypothetical protein
MYTVVKFVYTPGKRYICVMNFMNDKLQSGGEIK